MPGKTPYEAVEAYVQPLRQAISCLSQTAQLATAGGHFISDRPHALTLVNNSIRLRLQGSEGTDLTFAVSQQYKIVEHEMGFRVHTLKYAYKIDNWHDGHEVMAYHWHPSEQVKYPHLHLSYGAQVGREELRKAHVPTGRIALEDVIQFLIESFGVVPAKEQWETVLDEGRENFRVHRSWS